MHLSLALLVLLFSLILSNVINRVFPRLPLPLIQIIFGVGIGLLFKGRAFELETELFLAFIIAPLLFREGEESDITSILRNWKLILFLIFPVIFVSTLGIGYLAKAVLPASVPLSACLAIGAALGPTDLVAYSAISKRFSFPKWISYILQGEGLLNDASGLVAFQVAVTALTTGTFSLLGASWNLVISVLGGFLVGLITALFNRLFLTILDNMDAADVTGALLLELVLPISSYFVAEEIHASGIIAVVVAGISLASRFKKITVFDAKLDNVSHTIWGTITFMLNGMVFFLLGTELPTLIMARQKKPVHRVQMTEGKRNIIHQLLEEYDIQSAEDIQDALKDLLGGTIKEMMEAEMDDHLGYEKSERSDNDDYRNGYKRKQVNSRYGSMEIEVPQDRKSTFEPQVVKKRQKDISDIDQKIISMYAKGMTTRQISETIEDIYGFETSESFISDVTDKILPQIEDWQNRPLDEVYPILYIDAIHYSVRDNGVIRKLAAYVILGINTEGKKEVLTISVGDNESAKYWLSVMNELKNRGVKDVLIICADGLTGIKEAIAAAFPKTEYQRCIVHQVRNTLKYVPDKDRKAFATDLKTIYQATDEKKALAALERVTEKWTPKYPNSMKRWKDNWDAISPIFKFSTTVRTVIYTTNAIESLNSTYRKLNRQRSVFPSDTALLKALYLATFEATKKWTSTIRNWAQVYGELSIMYEGRLPE